MTENAQYVNEPWTWRDRLRFKFFPSRVCELPTPPSRLPPHLFEDCLVARTVVGLGWQDRLRVLVSGHLLVETRTLTEHIVGATVTSSVAYPILRPAPPQEPKA